MSNCKINYRRAKVNRIRIMLRKLAESSRVATRYMDSPQADIYLAISATAKMLDLNIQHQCTYRPHLPQDMQPFGVDTPIESMPEKEFRVLYGNIREQVVAFMLLFTSQLTPLKDTAEGIFTLDLFQSLEHSLEASRNQ